MIDILLGIILYILLCIGNGIIAQCITYIGCLISGCDWWDVTFEIAYNPFRIEDLVDRGFIGTIIALIIVGVVMIFCVTGVYAIFIHPIIVYKAIKSVKKDSEEVTE